MKKMIRNEVGAWLRGLVWTAMIAGCAWASAQNYLVTPSTGRYHAVAMGAGEGVGIGQGIGAEGAQSAQPLPKDDLFAGTEVFAKGASDITEITMDPDTLNLVNGNDERRARSMVLNVVRTYTYDKPGMYNMSDVDAIRNKLNTGDWHCSVHVRDLKNGSGSDVCGKRRTDGMRETAIIEVEPKQLTFIHTIRRAGGPGSSEVGFFPMLPGLSGLPALAMMDPEVFADMQIGLHGMPFVYATPGMHVFTFDSKDMNLKMGEMDKQLKELKIHPPMDPEQMEKLNKQMKDFNKDFYKNKDSAAPAAPATPKAAPAPAPQPPQ
jgi:hypothetical protein